MNVWSDILMEDVSIIEEQVYVLGDRHKKDKKIDTSDLGKLQARLISFAKHNPFKKKDYEKFSKSLDGSKDEKSYDRISKLELGYCFKDKNENYLVYSEKAEKFYYMVAGVSGFENTRKPVSMKKVKSIVDKLDN